MVIYLFFFWQSAGLKEGDYIVSVGGVDCKWLGVNEVLEKLKSVGEQPIEFEVISCQDTTASMVRNEADTFVDLMYGFFFFSLASVPD